MAAAKQAGPLATFAYGAAEVVRGVVERGWQAAGIVAKLLASCAGIATAATSAVAKHGKNLTDSQVKSAVSVAGKRCAADAQRALTEALALLPEWTKTLAAKVATYGKLAADKIAAAALATWNALVNLGQWVLDLVLDKTSKLLGFVLFPITKLTVPALAAAPSRRGPVALCSSSFMNVNVGNLLANAMRGALSAFGTQVFGKSLTKAWQTMKASAELGKYKKNARAFARKRGVEPLDAMIKRRAAASMKIGAAVGVSVALHALAFPIGYLSAGGTCYADAAAVRSESEYKACYRREFVDVFSKNWLWDLIIGAGVITALDYPVIMPIATSVGSSVATIVASAIAAATGGVGAFAAPAVGALVAFVVKVGISVALDLLARKAFFSVYERTTWKQSEGFFGTKMMGKAPDFFWQLSLPSLRPR